MISDKIKLLLAICLLESLKKDVEHRLYKCEDCEFTLTYVNYCLKILKDETSD